MEFSWALQHQSNDQNGRNHPNDHHEDANIINQVSARRLLSVAGNQILRIICVNDRMSFFPIFLYYRYLYSFYFFKQGKIRLLQCQLIISRNYIIMKTKNRSHKLEI